MPIQEVLAENRNEDLFITEIRTPSEASYNGIDSALRNASVFLRNLPQIPLNEVPEDHRECGICHEEYGTGERDEKIVQLPQCGHRFGLMCINEWLSPTQIPNRDTCPMCRTILFEIDESGWSDHASDSDDEAFDDLPPFTGHESDAEYLIPELYALLELDSFDAFVEAIAFLEPYMTNVLPLPRGLTYSHQVLALFQSFQTLRTPGPDEEIPTDGILMEMTTKMARMMGSLYVRFGPWLGMMRLAIPWREEGPRIRDVIDAEMHGIIECGVAHFIRLEDLHGPQVRMATIPA